MIAKAAKTIQESEVVIITAGAGMGVDSGLPDFRGDKGFWNAYPAYERQRLSFIDCANPKFFSVNPQAGWGFYGHRTNLYRETIPHEGFSLLKKWAKDYFVVTSNVDGQFQKAGFSNDKIVEIHGSIHRLQCQNISCKYGVQGNLKSFIVNLHNMMLLSQPPRCELCGEILRPNILMFGDEDWDSRIMEQQEERFEDFLSKHYNTKITVIELGAGSSIPTIRYISEQIGWKYDNATVIRINPTEAEIPTPHISLPFKALEGLQLIEEYLTSH